MQDYAAFFHSSLVGIYRTTLDGEILVGNQAMAKILAVDDPVGLDIKVFYVNLEDREKLISRLKKEGIVENFQFQIKTATGDTKWVTLSSRYDTELRAIDGYLLDVTDHVEIENRLKLAHDQETAILNALPDLVVTMDRDGNIKKFHNPESGFFPGIEKYTQNHISDLVEESAAAELLEIIKTLKPGQVEQFDHVIDSDSKGEVFLEARLTLIGDDEVLAVTRDVSERIEDERTIKYISVFETLVARLAMDFLESATDQIDTKIQIGLEAIGRFANAQASFLISFPSEKYQELSHLWSVREQADTARMADTLSANSFVALRELLRKQGIVKIVDISDTKTLPEPIRKELDLIKDNNVKSLIGVPMMRGEEMMGMFGMATFSETYDWGREFESRMRIASEMFTNAIIKKNLDAQVNQLYDSQSKLFSQIAHSLKTPFTVALNNLQLLKQSKQGDDTSSYINTIRDNLLESTEILNQLLQVAKMDIFSPNSKKENINTKELLEQVFGKAKILFRSHYPHATDKDIERNITLGNVDEQTLHGDRRSLTEAVLILMDNALIHSPFPKDWPQINLTGDASDGQYIIRVEDKGRGIPESDLDQVFELYYQGKNSSAGSGIGLAFCKKIVNSLGGEISLSSTVNKGTTVEVRLPIKPL